MRIIAGRFRGHQLVSFKASHIRPTTDRVKESMFNILGGDLSGMRVIDGFCGTGNLGLEALSRGADHVTFVENHRKSIQILKQNLQKLKIESGYKIIQQDVFQFLRQCSDSADILFFDPPFTQSLADEVMTAVVESRAIQPESTIVIESSAQELIKPAYGEWESTKSRSYGDKLLSIFTHS